MTALVGQNGVGKTTMLRAMGEVARIASADTELPDNSSRFRRRGAEQEMLAASWLSETENDDVDHGLTSGGGVSFQTQASARREGRLDS
jgi:ABC-type cobalamin/Fe3+-siderophores transport system ATPase subunit